MFNQFYGLWHQMSQANLYPEEAKSKITPEETGQSIKEEEVSVKVELQEVVEESKDVKEETPNCPETGFAPEIEDATPEIEGEKDSLVTTEEAPKGQSPETQDTGTELDEDLCGVNYLHLPSKSVAELNERIKNSRNCRRKFRLWKETMGMCVYCGKHINALDFVSGVNSDIEHILPQALGGTSVFENLVCSCRKCNRAKGDMTAMDYVLTLNSRQQSNFLNRLRLLVSSGAMSQEKYFNMLRPVKLVNFENAKEGDSN